MAGDTVHLVGTFTNTLTVGASGTYAQPVTVSFFNGAQFVLSGAVGIAIDAGANNGLLIDGGGSGVIQWTNNGTALLTQTSVCAVHSSGATIGNLEVRNLICSNLFIHTPGVADSVDYGHAIYFQGTMTNLSVHNCSVYEARGGIFAAYRGAGNANWTFYSNTLSDCAWNIICGDTSAGSSLTGVTAHHNSVTGLGKWDTSNNFYHEDGIFLWADQSGSSITNVNIFSNTFGPDNGYNSTADIYLSSNGARIWNVSAFNNLFHGNAPSNGAMYLWNVTGANIFNNVFFFGPGQLALRFNTTVNVMVYNNIWDNVGSPINITDAARANGFVCDYNVFWQLAPWGGSWGDMAQYTYATWRSRGYDAHSVTADPLFADTSAPDFHLLAGSPAIGAGTNLTGWGVSGLTLDYAGNARPGSGAWDIGAYAGTNKLPVHSVIAPPGNLRLAGP